MAISFSGGWNRSTRREPQTMGKQLDHLQLWVMFVVNWLLPKKVEFVEDYSLFVVQKENHTEISKNFNIR
jgi:hypothetical protein